MLGQRSVACLAVHMRVFPVLLYVQHIRVAGFTCLMAGKVNRASGNFADRIAAIVAVLPKAFRDDITYVKCKSCLRENFFLTTMSPCGLSPTTLNTVFPISIPRINARRLP